MGKRGQFNVNCSHLQVSGVNCWALSLVKGRLRRGSEANTFVGVAAEGVASGTLQCSVPSPDEMLPTSSPLLVVSSLVTFINNVRTFLFFTLCHLAITLHRMYASAEAGRSLEWTQTLTLAASRRHVFTLDSFI